MAYTCSISIVLGTSKTNLTLVAQLIDTSGVSVGDSISSGFVEIGQGNYLWTYNGFPDSFRGGVRFAQQSTPSSVLAFVAINPEDAELIEKTYETTSSHNQIEIKAPTLISSTNAEVEAGNSRGNNVQIVTKSESVGNGGIQITTGIG